MPAPRTNPDEVCRIILAIVASTKNASDSNVGASAIGHLLRIYGHVLVSSKSQGEKLISDQALTSSEPKETDHAIPINILTKNILGLDPAYLNNTPGNFAVLRVMVQDHIRTVTVTKSEHDKLASKPHSLKSTMPNNWSYDDNWQARYKAVGIQVLRELPEGGFECY